MSALLSIITERKAQSEVLTSPEGSEPELLAIMVVQIQSNRDHVKESQLDSSTKHYPTSLENNPYALCLLTYNALVLSLLTRWPSGIYAFVAHPLHFRQTIHRTLIALRFERRSDISSARNR
jgi:hypothetical protein